MGFAFSISKLPVKGLQKIKVGLELPQRVNLYVGLRPSLVGSDPLFGAVLPVRLAFPIAEPPVECLIAFVAIILFFCLKTRQNNGEEGNLHVGFRPRLVGS